MAYDFPSSPTVGQASNGYVWSGTAWVGLGGSAPASEQFFDLTGLTSLDITVPTWAKGVHIEGSVFTGSATSWPILQVSWDGTTFLTGGTDYRVTGPYHDVSAAVPYGSQLQVSTLGLYLSYPRDTPTVPHLFSGDMVLATAAGQFATLRVASVAYSTGAFGTRHAWLHCYPGTPVAGQVKKLRISNNAGGAMVATSWLRVKWLGDYAQVQTGNAIPEAPSDGREYVRINGVWRVKTQTLLLDGVNIAVGAPVAVPSGARAVRFDGSMALGTTASLSPTMRVSVDGTNMLAGASDYTSSGVYFGTTTSTANALAAVNGSSFTLAVTTSNSATSSSKIDGLLTLLRTPATIAFHGRSTGTAITSTVQYQSMYQFYMGSAAVSGVASLLALSFGAHNNSGIFIDSYVHLEWIY